MINALTFLISFILIIIAMLTSIPAGRYLRNRTRDEIIAARKWLKFLSLICLAVVLAVISLFFLNIVELKLMLSLGLALVYFAIAISICIKQK